MNVGSVGNVPQWCENNLVVPPNPRKGGRNALGRVWWCGNRVHAVVIQWETRNQPNQLFTQW